MFHILLALGDGEQHGYAIMQRVEELTDGAVRMGPGTLYGAIKRMLADGLIEETDERPDPELDDQRRRYYRITALGRGRVPARSTRLETLLRNARRATELGTLMRGERALPRPDLLYPRELPARVRRPRWLQLYTDLERAARTRTPFRHALARPLRSAFPTSTGRPSCQ